jgi:hypothetical protein
VIGSKMFGGGNERVEEEEDDDEGADVGAEEAV